MCSIIPKSLTLFVTKNQRFSIPYLWPDQIWYLFYDPYGWHSCSKLNLWRAFSWLSLIMMKTLRSFFQKQLLNSSPECKNHTLFRTKMAKTRWYPWITSELKELIQARQRALSRGDNQQFREIRNRVNRERTACRAKYFQAKVEHLKECKPSV